MRVIHIIPHLGAGGAERLVVDIVRELSKHESITVNLILLYPKIQYDISDIESLVHVIPAEIKLSVFGKNLIKVSALQAFIKKFKPDIIHSHLFLADIVSRSCYYPAARWITHCHGFLPELRIKNILSFFSRAEIIQYFDLKYLLERYKANGNNVYIAVSEPIKNFVTRNIKTKCYVLHNAIRVSNFTKRVSNKDFLQGLKIVSVGRFDENKNHIFLLDVLRFLLDKQVDAHLFLIGDGATKQQIVLKIKLLKLENKVSLLGFVSNIEDYYSQYHMYIHSAKNEALGLTLIEAMAAGLPVVSLDGGGNKALIEQGRNGYLIQKEDKNLFAERIIDLWNDKEKYKAVSEYAAEYAKQFDIEQYTHRLINIYVEVLDRKFNLN
jgi:glycosyltransferase involved in cell wall biosynthesis